MFRRLSTKWVLTVLAAVLVPFLCYAVYLSRRLEQRESDTVKFYLLSLASELADRVDSDLAERRWDVEFGLARNPVALWLLKSLDDSSREAFQGQLTKIFTSFTAGSTYYDRALLVDRSGKVLVLNERGPGGESYPPEGEEHVRQRDLSHEEWFRRALDGQTALVDHHATDLVPAQAVGKTRGAQSFHIGIAAPVHDDIDPGQVVGVVYVLVDWRHFQDDVIKPPRPSVRTPSVPDIYASCYSWLWKSDCDTIIAHQDTALYNKSVTRDTGLPQLVEAARMADAGLYPDYSFRGVEKKAAFKHCNSAELGGLGWVVGVGINDQDSFVLVQEVRRILVIATLFALGFVLLFTIVIARRTTAPIRALQQQTQRIAAGDFEARLDVRSQDELGDLARAFDRMALELGESRAKLIKAEKDAAWREMARQVAHEIKNPLTPISLSATLLKRARAEKSPEFDAIFERTIDMIQRQVEAMRQIASDFSAFAGNRKATPERLDARALVEEVLELNAAWARELKVEVTLAGECGMVFADRGELRRVLINLVSNAFEAMAQGGRLAVELARVEEGGRWNQITLQDTGVGLSTEVRRHLFEPYFTTRTHGTGLGLAICARLVHEMGGTIELVPVPGGPGTRACIRLPEPPA